MSAHQQAWIIIAYWCYITVLKWLRDRDTRDTTHAIICGFARLWPHCDCLNIVKYSPTHRFKRQNSPHLYFHESPITFPVSMRAISCLYYTTSIRIKFQTVALARFLESTSLVRFHNKQWTVWQVARVFRKRPDVFVWSSCYNPGVAIWLSPTFAVGLLLTVALATTVREISENYSDWLCGHGGQFFCHTPGVILAVETCQGYNMR